jgi:hypothetical protein
MIVTNGGPERLKIRGRRLRQGIEFAKQLLYPAEFHRHPAAIEGDPIGEDADHDWNDRNANRSCGAMPVQAVEFLGQTRLPLPLVSDLGTRFQGFQSPNQIHPVQQDRVARLIPAKPVHELDGTAPPDTEDALTSGTVDDRDFETTQFHNGRR